MTWKRARNDDQIEQRRRAILEATSRLFSMRDYADITFSRIALEAGVAKSNIYRYFESKEAIFAQLLVEELEFWAERFVSAAAAVPEGDVELFCRATLRTAQTSSRFLELISIKASIIDRHISVETALHYRQQVRDRVKPAIVATMRIFPGMTPQQADELFTVQQALLAGFYPMQATNEALRGVCEERNLGHLVTDVTQTLERTLLHVINGAVQNYCLETEQSNPPDKPLLTNILHKNRGTGARW